MAKSLTDVLTPPRDSDTLRWRAVVPMATNPFILMELLQFAFVGACVVFIVLATGFWLTDEGLGNAEIMHSLGAAAYVLGAVVVGFVLVCVVFFGNRYFAVYNLDRQGIYHEGSRGSDERHEFIGFRARPYPVSGAVKADRTRSRTLMWEKVTAYQSMPGMRVIVLRRGSWHMMRLYMPDAETHAEVVRFLDATITCKPCPD